MGEFLSGVLGGLVVLAGLWLRDKWERQKETRQAQRDREQEVRKREVEAAEKIDELFSSLERDTLAELRRRGSPQEPRSPWDERIQDRITGAADQIGAQAAFLPRYMRIRLVELRDFISNVSDLQQFHHQPGQSIVTTSSREAHEVIAAFLRHDDLPSANDLIEEYSVTMEQVEAIYYEVYEEAEAEERRAKWRRTNLPAPETAKE